MLVVDLSRCGEKTQFPCSSAYARRLHPPAPASSRKSILPYFLHLRVRYASTCAVTAAAAAISSQRTLSLSDFPTDLFAFTDLLQQCGTAKDLSDGRLLHATIMDSPFCRSTRLSSSIMHMYGRHAALEDALALFWQIQWKNIYSWNIMIGVTVKLGIWMKTGELFRRMQLECALQDKYAVVSTLSAYVGLGKLLEGKMIHARFSCTELEEDVIVGSALINLYGSHSSAELAIVVFERVREPDLVSWNTLMTACAHKGQGNVAFQVFEQMLQQGFVPDRVSFLAVVDACDTVASLSMGNKLHVHVACTEYESDAFLLTSFMSMYGKCGDSERAYQLFDKMSDRNVVSWNAVIAVHSHQHSKECVYQLFLQMQEEGSLPDKITFRTILCSFTGYSNLSRGKLLHINVSFSGFDTDMVVGTALFSMYGRCGRLNTARELFDSMTDKDLVAWNAMIALYAQNELAGNAILVLLKQMEVAGVLLDNVTLTSALSVCVDVSFEAAKRLFEKVRQHNVLAWNAMLGACEQRGYSAQACNLVARMLEEGITPDKVTYLVLLSLSRSMVDSERCNCVYTIITYSQLESEGLLVSSLISTYSKCCCLDEFDWVFRATPVRDVVVFNSFITACVDHGDTAEVLQVWGQSLQEGMLPDEVTCIGIFDVCALQGYFPMGKFLHACIMKSDYMSDIILVTSLFNMYNKCRSLEEALRVFSCVIQHDAISWTAIISASAKQKQCKDVIQLFRQMQNEGVHADNDLYVNAISAYADETVSAEGKALHCQICYNISMPNVSLANALINWYNKCGYVEYAEHVFRNMTGRDVLTYNVMIAGLAQHGNDIKAFQLYDLMQKDGAIPNDYTFSSILCACSHGGLVEEGWTFLIIFVHGHCWRSVMEQFDCMVDLLGRSGQLEEAEWILGESPLQPMSVSYMTLLGAAKVQTDTDRGGIVSKYLLELDDEDGAWYVALANLYASAGDAPSSRRPQISG